MRRAIVAAILNVVPAWVAFGQSTAGPPVIAEAYGKLPLSFESNQGQMGSEVNFLSRGKGYSLYLTSTGAVLSLRRAMVRMKLVGANPSAQVTGLDRLPGKSNYFIGNDPHEWRVGIPTYARVKYPGVYPGIDMVYYGNQRELEYDITVAPGADPRRIRLRLEGAGRMWFSGGDVVLGVSGRQLRIGKPIIYQPCGSGRCRIGGEFVRTGKNEIGFHLAAYDTSRPLVLDPVISYSTYLGGTGFDSGKGIAVDSGGNAYITGQTNSIDFPTVPPYENAFGGSNNVFVTKLNPSGTALVYSTTIGGSGDESGNGIAVDAAGNAYVTGVTNSKNFPIVGGFQTSASTSVNLNGTTSVFNQAFVLKLNPAGTALVYSSYLGGSGNDFGRGIAVDAAGNAYVTGNAYSFNFPVKNPIQATKGDLSTGIADVFAAKVNAAGNALVYATYLGGSADDEGAAIAVDNAGNAYITGETISPNFPVVKPLQGSRAGNPNSAFYDAFVAKINSAGTALVYSTYLGGSNTDAGNGIAVDSGGGAYVAGYTFSRDFPVAPPQSVAGTAFVTKLSGDGSTVVYSRNFGGNGTDTAAALAVDAAGNAYVTGSTTSTNFPSIGAPESLTGLISSGFFAQAAFVTEINAGGTALVYSTPFGGGSDSGAGIAVDSAGNAYLTGQTGSQNFPTVNPIQMTLGGGLDAFAAKLAGPAQPPPNILANGVVNGASFRLATDPNGAVAPGSIVSIFGGNLAPASRSATSLPLPTSLFDTSVTFNGVAAPLFYVSSTQINAQVPFETPTGPVTVQIQRADGTTGTQTVMVAAVSPGIFTLLQQGAMVGAILHGKDFTPVTPAAPAVSGETLSIFATGLGALQQPVAEGTLPPSPPPETTALPTVTIGGVAAAVGYSGLAARLAGVYQINVQMPAVTATPGTVAVQIRIGGVSSNAVALFAE
jgi:uncharacterized protein (TIGR03437 family)